MNAGNIFPHLWGWYHNRGIDISASLILWFVQILILRGVKQAAALNTIATIAKIVPLFIFLGFVIHGFKTDIFALNFWGGEVPDAANIFHQVRSTMLLTVFVFVGIEGARGLFAVGPESK